MSVYLLCSDSGVELLKLPQTELVVVILVEELKDDGCLLFRHGELCLQHVQGVWLLQALHEVLHVLAEDLPHVVPKTGAKRVIIHRRKEKKGRGGWLSYNGKEKEGRGGWLSYNGKKKKRG